MTFKALVADLTANWVPKDALGTNESQAATNPSATKKDDENLIFWFHVLDKNEICEKTRAVQNKLCLLVKLREENNRTAEAAESGRL